MLTLDFSVIAQGNSLKTIESNEMKEELGFFSLMGTSPTHILYVAVIKKRSRRKQGLLEIYLVVVLTKRA